MIRDNLGHKDDPTSLLFESEEFYAKSLASGTIERALDDDLVVLDTQLQVA